MDKQAAKHNREASIPTSELTEAPKNIEGDESHVVRSLESSGSEEKTMKRTVIGVYLILVLLGIGTGYLLSRTVSLAGTTTKSSSTATTATIGKTVGISDSKTFKDQATGVIEKGGFDGEGTHKLIRDGGPSQTVYLISSVVDLDQYAGKKVTIWGQTMAAKKVAWLMDVGKIELK